MNKTEYTPIPIVVKGESDDSTGKRKQIVLLVHSKEKNATPQKIMETFRNICMQYAQTEDGKTLAEKNGNMLGWDEVINDIPASFLVQYGMRIVSVMEISFQTPYEEPLWFNEETCL